MSVVDAFDFFAKSIAEISPKQILNLKAPQQMAVKVEELIAKKKAEVISEEENIELERYLALDLIISLAKARAAKLLSAA